MRLLFGIEDMNFEQYSQGKNEALMLYHRMRQDAQTLYMQTIATLDTQYRVARTAEQQQQKENKEQQKNAKAAELQEQKAKRDDQRLRRQIGAYELKKSKVLERLTAARSALAHTRQIRQQHPTTDAAELARYQLREQGDQELCQQLETELNNLVNPV